VSFRPQPEPTPIPFDPSLVSAANPRCYLSFHPAARGNSLYAALLVNAVSRDEETVLALHRSLFNMIPEGAFQEMVNELRKAMRMETFKWSLI